MALSNPNPKRLALWTIAGATLMASTFFVAFLPKVWLDSLAFRCTVLLVPSVLGLIVWFLAHRRLRRGYVNELWSQSELAPVRALLTNTLMQWTMIGFVVCAIAAIAFTKHSGALFNITTLPLYALASMRRLLVPKPEPPTIAFNEWRNLKPLQSEHWGESTHTPLPF